MSQPSFFARLIGSTAAISAPALAASAEAALAPQSADNGAAPVVDEARIETALQAAHSEGRAAGATAERERTQAVLNSDAGKANMTMAAWMLNSSPAADANGIISQLSTMPAAAAAPAPAPAAATPPVALATLEQTPVLAIQPNGQANDGGSGAASKQEIDSLWDAAIKGTGLTAGGTNINCH